MGYIILIILNILSPLVGAGVILMFLFSPRRNLLKNLKNEFSERFVMRPKRQILGGYIWMHAASVGEVRSVVKIAQQLKDYYKRPILITTLTAAGRAAAEKEPVFDTAALAPLDFYPFVKKFLKIYTPRRLFIIEADLWPNMLVCCAKNNVPAGIINGRLSARSAGRYKLIAPLMKLVFKNMAFVCAQNEEIKDRYISLGLQADKAHICGNIKYDMLNEDPAHQEKVREILNMLGWQNSQIITCGSTHEVEERVIISAAQKLPDTKFIIAPRHLERKKQITAMLDESGLKYAVLSKRGGYPADAQILLADTMGWLGALYNAAAAAFVGGSIAKKGGHNFLEAAALGKPVLMGKYSYNAPEVAAKLLQTKGGFLVDENNFAEVIKDLISSQPGLAAASDAARGAALSFKGATDKTMAVVKEYESKRT